MKFSLFLVGVIISNLESTKGHSTDTHLFEVPFPFDGETVMLNCDLESGLCRFGFHVFGWLKSNLSIEQVLLYDTSISSNGVMVEGGFELRGTTEHPTLVTLALHQAIDRNTIYIPLDITIKLKDTNITVYNSHRNLIVIHPSDVGIRPYKHSDGIIRPVLSKMDFIELGTANFNTCIQQAEKLLPEGYLSSVNGISLDAMVQYLEDLPTVPGVTKIHAAISSDPKVTALAAYYIPETIVDKVGGLSL